MRRSLNFIAPKKIGIVEENIPSPAAGEALIENELSLISPGTELALFTGTHVGFRDPDIPWAEFPLLPGYAAAGRVAEAGEGCPLAAGERVMYYGPHSSYGILKTGSECWARIAEVEEENSLFGRFAQISATVPYLAKKRRGNVLVFGAGLIGNFCAQLFALDGDRKVISADLSERRLSLAKSCGIPYVINSGKEDLKTFIRRVTDGEGVALIVEATGVPRLVGQALELVNVLGAVYLLGSSRGDVTVNAYKHIHRKGVSLIGAHESVVGLLEKGLSSHPDQETLQRMAAYLSDGSLKTDGMITHRIVPDQAEEYYNHLLEDRDNYLGVVIDWRTR